MRKWSGFRWLELIIGAALILMGMFTFANPNRALSGLVILYGMVALVMGIADIVLYIQVERYTGFGPIISLISGILSVMSGLMLIVYPNAGKWVLSMLFPIWFIAHCVSRLSHLHMTRAMFGSGMYYFTLVVNIIGLILGIMMVAFPLFSLLSVSSIVAVYQILLGIDSIVLAFSNRSSEM